MVYRHHLLAMWEGMSEGTVGIRITEWTTPCSSDVRGKEKQPKTTGKKRGFRQEQILFQIQNGKCIHWPTSALNEIETEECAIQPSSPDLSHYEYEDRRRSVGPALSSALNEIETGECAIQPLFPDLSRCEYGDRRRLGGPALSYSVSQENLGSYSYSRPQRR